MIKKNKWIISDRNEEIALSFTKSLSVSLPLARLLVSRNITDIDSAEAFLKKSDEIFHDSFLLQDMDKGALRLDEAISKNEKIVIYGDYDVDGISATASLYTYLKNYTDNIDYYIPSRFSDGYGLNNGAIEKIASRGASLIITVDTGITACDEVKFASSLGIDIIITDHHECHGELPDACAVINPMRPDSKYPFKNLAGVGVVFKFCCSYEIYKETNQVCFDKENSDKIACAVRRVCKQLCTLVSIGTIADVMPVLDENRLIVTAGLHLLSKTSNLGLRALLKACSLGTDASRKITTSVVSFTLAPRINAVGRIGDAAQAVELFLTDDKERASELAQLLCDLNTERQSEENKILKEAEEMISADPVQLDKKIIVLGKAGWHHGVIGIVSSRLTEKYGLPSILVCFDENDLESGKGSGRSIPSFNLSKALSDCSEHLVKFGGHSQAAGLSVSKDEFENFKKDITTYADKHISEDDLISGIYIDEELKASDITEEFASELELLEPYGVGNPTPLFLARDLEISAIYPLSSGKHTKFLLHTPENNSITALYFGVSPDSIPFLPGDKIEAVFNLSINEYMGKRTVQMIIRDIRHNEQFEKQLESNFDIFEDIKAKFIYPADIHIPSKDDCKLLFRTLKNISDLEKKYINIIKYSKETNTDLVKNMLILDIFVQLGFIQITYEGYGIVNFSLIKTTEKKALESSELFSYLNTFK